MILSILRCSAANNGQPQQPQQSKPQQPNPPQSKTKEMFCHATGRFGDFMTGMGLGIQSQAGWEGFSIITGEELVAGSEFGPVGWGLVLTGAGLQVANDLICE